MPDDRSMTIDICRLCCETRELRNSHFVPAGFYKAARRADGGNSDLLIMTREIAIQTSEQAQQPLLCDECENRFNKLGEKWTLAHSCQANGRFPLRDILRASTAAHSDANAATFLADSIPAIKRDQLAYFGASIFWRGAIAEWHVVSSAPRLQLGPYEEKLRLYLLGQAEFPKDVVLSVSIDDSGNENVSHMGEFPHLQNRIPDYRHFTFTLNGLRFDLLVGRTMPLRLRETCIASGSRHPIFLMGHIGNLLIQSFVKMRRKARPVGKLKK